MNICPFLDISLYIASLIIDGFSSVTYVWTGYLFTGGVSIKDKSLIPTSDIWRVLGIGVALKVSTSIELFISFIFSLWVTPNLCSSSITSNPKSLYFIELFNSLCVPKIISIFPFTSLFFISFASFTLVNLFNNAIFIP